MISSIRNHLSFLSPYFFAIIIALFETRKSFLVIELLSAVVGGIVIFNALMIIEFPFLDNKKERVAYDVIAFGIALPLTGIVIINSISEMNVLLIISILMFGISVIPVASFFNFISREKPENKEYLFKDKKTLFFMIIVVIHIMIMSYGLLFISGSLVIWSFLLLAAVGFFHLTNILFLFKKKNRHDVWLLFSYLSISVPIIILVQYILR